ncbi:hypothetical protein U0070_024656 [Myodes glareolus]|uniref:Uncharacterized protein n=1 Tax=Myodes glareolus TaxID=447135 RepID=A0AAW0JY56_MYOGA
MTFEQDIERGNTDGLGDCHNSFVALNGKEDATVIILCPWKTLH